MVFYLMVKLLFSFIGVYIYISGLKTHSPIRKGRGFFRAEKNLVRVCRRQGRGKDLVFSYVPPPFPFSGVLLGNYLPHLQNRITKYIL